MSKKEFNQKIGKTIRKLRIKAQLTQEDLMGFGLTTRQYQRIESGEVNPKGYTLLKICRAFKCEPNDLFEGVGI